MSDEGISFRGISIQLSDSKDQLLRPSLRVRIEDVNVAPPIILFFDLREFNLIIIVVDS